VFVSEYQTVDKVQKFSDSNYNIPSLETFMIDLILMHAVKYPFCFKFLSMNNYLSERTCKPPETPEATALQIMKLLLACVFTGNHVLYDALNSVQDYGVMAR
jgi:hypothetical protein